MLVAQDNAIRTTATTRAWATASTGHPSAAPRLATDDAVAAFLGVHNDDVPAVEPSSLSPTSLRRGVTATMEGKTVHHQLAAQAAVVGPPDVAFSPSSVALVRETVTHLLAVGRRRSAAAQEMEASLRRAALWARSSDLLAQHECYGRELEADLAKAVASHYSEVVRMSVRQAGRMAERLRLCIDEAANVSRTMAMQHEEHTAAAHEAARLDRARLSTELSAAVKDRDAARTSAASKSSALHILTDQLRERDEVIAELQRRHLALVQRFAEHCAQDGGGNVADVMAQVWRSRSREPSASASEYEPSVGAAGAKHGRGISVVEARNGAESLTPASLSPPTPQLLPPPVPVPAALDPRGAGDSRSQMAALPADLLALLADELRAIGAGP